jgi:thermitase
MKKIISLVSIISILIINTVFGQSSQYHQTTVYFTTGVTRTVTSSDTSATVTATDIQAVLNKYNIPANQVYPAFPEFKSSDTLIYQGDGTSNPLKQMDKTKIFTITTSDTVTNNKLIRDLNNLPEVLFSENNGQNTPYTVPNDANFSQQWYLNNTTNPGVDVNAELAWNIYTGNPNNIIGIVDYGVDGSHPDLHAKIAGGDNTFSLKGGTLSHGTMVAGEAGALTNNSIGIAGMDWQIKLLSEDFTDYWQCFCINYFTKPHGDVLITKKITSAVNFSPNVFVLNHSWGLSYDNGIDGRYSTLVRDAFGYSYKQNRTSCAGAGDGTPTTPYPAAFSCGALIAVASFDINNIPSGSNAGTYIDVAAPGENIYSTNFNNSYSVFGGSSASTPLVSGIASLMKGYNASLYNDDIEEIIKYSATDNTFIGIGV